MPDTGWLDIGTAANYDLGLSDWVSLGNAVSEDANYSTNTCPAGFPTDDIRGYNLSESIPAGQQLDGVEVRLKGYGSDFEIGVVNLGLTSPTGTNKGDSATLPVSNDWSSTYGGPTDTWSTGFDIDDAKHSNFGVYIGLYNSSGSEQTAYIDVIQIKIYYSEEPISHYPLPPHNPV